MSHPEIPFTKEKQEEILREMEQRFQPRKYPRSSHCSECVIIDKDLEAELDLCSCDCHLPDELRMK